MFSDKLLKNAASMGKSITKLSSNSNAIDVELIKETIPILTKNEKNNTTLSVLDTHSYIEPIDFEIKKMQQELYREKTYNEYLKFTGKLSDIREIRSLQYFLALKQITSYKLEEFSYNNLPSLKTTDGARLELAEWIENIACALAGKNNEDILFLLFGILADVGIASCGKFRVITKNYKTVVNTFIVQIANSFEGKSELLKLLGEGIKEHIDKNIPSEANSLFYEQRKKANENYTIAEFKLLDKQLRKGIINQETHKAGTKKISEAHENNIKALELQEPMQYIYSKVNIEKIPNLLKANQQMIAIRDAECGVFTKSNMQKNKDLSVLACGFSNEIIGEHNSKYSIDMASSAININILMQMFEAQRIWNNEMFREKSILGRTVVHILTNEWKSHQNKSLDFESALVIWNNTIKSLLANYCNGIKSFIDLSLCHEANEKLENYKSVIELKLKAHKNSNIINFIGREAEHLIIIAGLLHIAEQCFIFFMQNPNGIISNDIFTKTQISAINIDTAISLVEISEYCHDFLTNKQIDSSVEIAKRILRKVFKEQKLDFKLNELVKNLNNMTNEKIKPSLELLQRLNIVNFYMKRNVIDRVIINNNFFSLDDWEKTIFK